MNENKGLKLFMVEFGEPSIDNFTSSFDMKPIFVIATTFDKAGVKAYEHACKIQEEKEKLVLDKRNDNSLFKSTEIKVRTVRLVSLEIIQ